MSDAIAFFIAGLLVLVSLHVATKIVFQNYFKARADYIIKLVEQAKEQRRRA